MAVRGLADVLRDLRHQAERRKMYAYRPYGHPDTLCPDGELWQDMHSTGEWCEWSNKPWQYDFHQAGKEHQQRLILAGNRPGKTRCAAAEAAFHLTGEYPDWWDGKRFSHPVLLWAGSPTNESSRDIVQKELLGGTGKDDIGTGMVPYDRIVGKPKFRQCGVTDVVDQFKVRHVSGGVSTAQLKSYEQGWRKWQGTAPHAVWLDEEPDNTADQSRIRTEALTRLLTSNGVMMVTFTPLLGVTELVRHFQNGGKGIWMGTATWDDAPHLNKDRREEMAASYPDHERQARTRGVPMMGEGAVFTTPEDEITVDPFELPPHFARLKGIDFGIDHPAAVCEIAWDRDQDIIYLVKDWKKKGAEAEEHAEAINGVDPWVPVAWPHDGTSREKSSGLRLKDIYVKHGVKMLSQSARYKNDAGGGQPKEPVVVEIQQRCRSGSFKVFKTCINFLDEYRNYHRKDGRLVDRHDDALKACFYAVMMRRYATTQSFGYHAVSMPAPLRV